MPEQPKDNNLDQSNVKYALLDSPMLMHPNLKLAPMQVMLIDCLLMGAVLFCPSTDELSMVVE